MMILLFLVTMALGLLASWKVRSTYNRYSQVPASSGRETRRRNGASRTVHIDGSHLAETAAPQSRPR